MCAGILYGLEACSLNISDSRSLVRLCHCQVLNEAI